MQPVFKWLNKQIVLAIHNQQIVEHGGSPGLLNPGLLESSLASPLNIYNYEENSSVFDLAAAYGFSLVKNHAFFDGNKRVAFMSMFVFLKINGFLLEAPEEEATLLMLNLAESKESQQSLAQWLEKFSVETRR
jgi:death on curing protein